ncbi:phosphatase PAP2 family protein [Planococcus lenghuensis]|uniref:Phosphoesterase n=1 Tax=Planococcus lenghuensis TaxID=2213202 RepID=A0A1Q2KZ28_9BACL|nr:phosphatase PAP2 family protein [Planococcus lenghuensis]AQQ53423.1 phosphoesterase [Planococcus lenghuensis]
MDQDAKKPVFPVLLLIIGLAVAALLIYLFAELAGELMEQELSGFDDMIIGWFEAWNSPTLDAIMIFITELGSVWFLTVASIVVVGLMWFKLKDKWGIVYFIIAIAGAGGLTWFLKQVYQRERPSINPDIDAIGFSFPSGHSMGSLVFYGFVAFLIIRNVENAALKWLSAALAVILAILIGASRVYLAAHFPSDVLAGQLAGGVWLLLCILALQWTNYRHNRRKYYELRE